MCMWCRNRHDFEFVNYIFFTVLWGKCKYRNAPTSILTFYKCFDMHYSLLPAGVTADTPFFTSVNIFSQEFMHSISGLKSLWWFVNYGHIKWRTNDKDSFIHGCGCLVYTDTYWHTAKPLTVYEDGWLYFTSLQHKNKTKTLPTNCSSVITGGQWHFCQWEHRFNLHPQKIPLSQCRLQILEVMKSLITLLPVLIHPTSSQEPHL